MKTTMNQRAVMSMVVVFLAGILMSGNIYAQRGHGWGKGPHEDCPKEHPMMKMLDLSDEQQAQMKELHTKHMKEMLPIKNKMGELKAELNTLSTGDDVNMNAVEKKIDEIADLKAKMMKRHQSHRQEVRDILDDEQKVIFDAHHSRMGKGCGFGHGRGHYGKGFHGKGRGLGPCGQGMGPGPKGN
ncbi:MAG: Spy/CpxP family protein refolding chaperone [Bacteroidales bacterium]|nr:Spy/CpxP family protein refolding chaperone [Bacteroidales bacterium]